MADMAILDVPSLNLCCAKWHGVYAASHGTDPFAVKAAIGELRDALDALDDSVVCPPADVMGTPGVL